MGTTTEKSKMLEQQLIGMGFTKAYRFCRKAGLKPWCSVKYAMRYGTL